MLINHLKSSKISQGNITQVGNVEKRKDSTTYIREAKEKEEPGREGSGRPGSWGHTATDTEREEQQ